MNKRLKRIIAAIIILVLVVITTVVMLVAIGTWVKKDFDRQVDFNNLAAQRLEKKMKDCTPVLKTLKDGRKIVVNKCL